MNKYLFYDDRRAPKVREMFSRLAERYDLINDIMSFGLHRRWKRQTVAVALEGCTSEASVLDLCCGTADMCFLAEEIGPRDLRVIGVDFTLPMLAVARRRKLQSLSRTSFSQADAMKLPFPDETFDAITIGYGLRNIADPEAALSEILRVLRPGGRVAILDFGKPENPIASALYQGFLRTMMPAVGLIFHGDADTYLYIPESLKKYPAQRGVAELMASIGFENVRYEERLLGTMSINVGEAPARAA